MKASDRSSREGTAIVTAILFTFVASALVGSYIAYSTGEASLTRRMIDHQKARIAAEAALDYGLVNLRDVILWNQMTLPRTTLEYLLESIPPPPPIGDYVYMTPGGDNAFEITVISEVITGVITQGVVGLSSEGEAQQFTITAGALNPESGVGAVIQQDLQAVGLFLIRFGVFYEEDLEINPGPQMIFRGRVHSNADMYLTCGNSLRFKDRVTARGNAFRQRKDQPRSNGAVYIDNRNGIEVPMNTDSNDEYWMIDALWLWGGNMMTGEHGVSRLHPPIAPVDVPHDLIELPIAPSEPAYQAKTEQEKFHNKACLRITVSNGVLSAVDSRGLDLSGRFSPAVLRPDGSTGGRTLFAKNSSGHYRFDSAGAYGVASNEFRDAREGVDMEPVDIYVDEFIAAFPEVCDTTYSVAEGRGVVHVTRHDSDGDGVGRQPCLRIRNGTTLPNGGISFATDLPVYLEGDYNINNTQPALLAGDAVTFLSKNWQDARSWSSLSSRSPVNTSYNAVVMTGNSESSWGHYNGGLENVLRFIENWTGKTVYFRGSIIDLWYSERVTAPWSYGSYYTAPNRDWGYDEIYRTRVPPGMTRVFGLEELDWRDSSWAAVGWE